MAAERNDFIGDFLPLYLLSPHQQNDYRFSNFSKLEALSFQGTIVLPTRDVYPETRKQIGDYSSWGRKVEVIMSNKTYLWSKFSLEFFIPTPYIMKGDDDAFIRVTQHLSNLRMMPRKGLNMGKCSEASGGMFEDKPVSFIAGYCNTLPRDVAQAVVSYKPPWNAWLTHTTFSGISIRFTSRRCLTKMPCSERYTRRR